MTSPVSVTGHEQTSGNRYRLPGIAREGIAQLSLLETALWPLKGGQRDATTFETTYSFKAGTETRQAKVSVYAPLGLQSIDEFDLDVYRDLTPGARRLFLKLKDHFWRSKRVFLNVDDLTIHRLGFSADRPLKKRKFDLTACIRELMKHGIVQLEARKGSVLRSILRGAILPSATL